MTPKQYKKRLKEAIEKYGYWSEEVYALNNLAIDTMGFAESSRVHDKVRGEISAKQPPPY